MLTRSLSFGLALGLLLSFTALPVLAGPDSGPFSRTFRIALFQWGEAPTEEEDPYDEGDPPPRGTSIMHGGEEDERVRVEGEAVRRIWAGITLPITVPVAGMAGSGEGADREPQVSVDAADHAEPRHSSDTTTATRQMPP